MSLGDARRVSDEHDSHALAEDVLGAARPDLALEPARPYPKSTQLARAERRHHRRVASPQGWQRIADAKQGPCRGGCGTPPPNDLAHLIGRAQGGSDSEWNIVPLCRHHHLLFDQRDAETCRRVAETLTDAEYAGLIEWGGEDVFERRFGIRYERS